MEEGDDDRAEWTQNRHAGEASKIEPEVGEKDSQRMKVSFYSNEVVD